ncbi:MAG: sulfur carrier protein ThiS [Firmicutes bacterium]|nr:sulfur carrier protein ThiS [Bacillota bacterium]
MITINGKNIFLEDGYILAEYLKKKEYPIQRIAVEINGNMIPKSKYDTTILKDNDIIEIVSFVGGG